MLSSSSVAWSGLLDSILRWLVLSLRHGGHLGRTSSWGSCIGHWLGGSHWLGCILRSHLRLDNGSVDDLLGWHELLAGWERSELLLSVKLNVLFILSSLIGQLLIHFLSKFLHEIFNSLFNLLINEV